MHFLCKAGCAEETALTSRGIPAGVYEIEFLDSEGKATTNDNAAHWFSKIRWPTAVLLAAT